MHDQNVLGPWFEHTLQGDETANRTSAARLLVQVVEVSGSLEPDCQLVEAVSSSDRSNRQETPFPERPVTHPLAPEGSVQGHP
jgi:hypothetical protein